MVISDVTRSPAGTPKREHIDQLEQLLEFFFVQHAEPLFLVDDHEAEIFENDVAGDESMGSDNNIDAAVAQGLGRVVLGFERDRADLASDAAARGLGLSVMVFTGFTLEELRAREDPAIDGLLAETDILVDGRYERTMPDSQRRWIGSTNQRIHFLTDRYRADDPCWRMPNTLEIRLTGTELSVNGFPAAKAVGLWKRPVKNGGLT